MLNGLVDSAANHEAPEDERIYGLHIARVVNIRDCTGYHRVQISMTMLPGVRLWARVATMMAGPGRGTYFIPQVGEEVVVAFESGDVRQPLILGGVWNGRDRPPAEQPEDAENRRMIRTPSGHELSFDDREASVCITNSEGHVVHLNRDEIRIEMAEEAATITLNDDGDLTLEANGTLTLQARDINIEAEQGLRLTGSKIDIEGDQDCSIRASTVRIN